MRQKRKRKQNNRKKTKRGFGPGVRTGAALWLVRGYEHGYD